MPVLLWILCALALLAALWLFLIFPARADEAVRGRFARRCYAHRGLYDNEAGIPENSLPAFENAFRKGYGCELDVQFTRDRQLVVFHDNSLKRACGVDANVWDMTLAELRALPLFGTQERIPLFSELLDTADALAQQPLIVEIKAEGRDLTWYGELCAAVMAELHRHTAEYCVESFHPAVVRWLRLHEPQVVRGQLVNGRRSSPNLPAPLAFALEQLLSGFLTRPHFIAFKEQDKNGALRVVRALGAMSVMWTVRTPERHAALCKTEDAIIFEHYEPDPRF